MKKYVLVLVVALGLFVAADFAAAATAEYQVSQQMRQQLRLTEDPAVRINGFPFLWQAVTGDYRNVRLEAKAVQVGELSEVGIAANLYHARAATSKVMSGEASRIKVDRVVGRAELKASDVGRFLGITDLRIAPAPKGALNDTESDSGSDSSDSEGDTGSDGQPENPSGAEGSTTDETDKPGSTVDRTKTTVQLDGSVNIGGTDVKVQVVAVMSLLHGQLKIEPRKLDLHTGAFGDIPIPELFERSVLQQFTTTLDPGMLPFAVTPTAVGVEHGALLVEGAAKNVVIDGGGMSTP